MTAFLGKRRTRPGSEETRIERRQGCCKRAWTLAEAELHALLETLAETRPSCSWTPWDVVAHLHYLRPSRCCRSKGEEPSPLADALRGHQRRATSAEIARREIDAWPRAQLIAALATCRRDGEACSAASDPKRLPWFGPDMGVRMFTTARYMETWAHGQEVYDLMRVSAHPHRPHQEHRDHRHEDLRLDVREPRPRGAGPAALRAAGGAVGRDLGVERAERERAHPRRRRRLLPRRDPGTQHRRHAARGGGRGRHALDVDRPVLRRRAPSDPPKPGERGPEAIRPRGGAWRSAIRVETMDLEYGERYEFRREVRASSKSTSPKRPAGGFYEGPRERPDPLAQPPDRARLLGAHDPEGVRRLRRRARPARDGDHGRGVQPGRGCPAA